MEKIKLHFKKHWYKYFALFLVIVLSINGVRLLRPHLDVDVKHNKIVVTKSKN